MVEGGVMEYNESFTVTWTDGGDPGREGYFDGAGELNDLLLRLFSGKEWRRAGPPIGANVMDSVVYGRQLSVTVSIKSLE